MFASFKCRLDVAKRRLTSLEISVAYLHDDISIRLFNRGNGIKGARQLWQVSIRCEIARATCLKSGTQV